MIVPFTVVRGDETIEGATNYAAVYETEARFDVGLPEAFGLSKLSVLYWLFWRSLHPDAPTDDDALVVDWLSSVTGIEYEREEDDPPPPG